MKTIPLSQIAPFPRDVQKGGATSSEKNKELMEACQQFESLFLNILLKQMRKTVPDSGFIPRSMERDIYESMFDEVIAQKTASTDGFGLAEMIYRQLIQKSGNKNP